MAHKILRQTKCILPRDETSWRGRNADVAHGSEPAAFLVSAIAALWIGPVLGVSARVQNARGVETMRHQSRISRHILWATLFFSATAGPLFAQSPPTPAGPAEI